MLAINDLSFYFGSRALYENISFHIVQKDKVGLIGANGTGKSTLLKLIAGDYQPDSGTISKSKECSIGFLNQDLLSYESNNNIVAVAMEAFVEANKLQKEINELLVEIETNYTDESIERLAKKQEAFERLEGYTLQSQTEEILEGLGFKTEDLEKPLRTFSGGWRMRVMLAKMLLAKPALLLLDEPTNHLDLPSIEWLEQYVKRYEGAVIIVSHDRQFLNNCITKTAEITQQAIHIYSGNYDFYLKEKELRSEIQRNAFVNQQKQIKDAEKFITRFKAKATKARQVQSRIKSLEKLERIDDVVDENAAIHFNFNFSKQSGKVVLDLKNISKSYGDKVILKNTTSTILRDDKIALIGANGKGKSTLLRIINGSEEIAGERKLGFNVIDAFFAQHQLESLNLENSILEELKQTGVDKGEMELRQLLGCFLFTDDDVFKKIKVLSGGEKSRVALAKTLISEANFLLLDEPTNHLDIQSVNMLIQALQQYKGSYVIVSHDRHFVTHTANKIWYIDNYEIKEYPGSYEEYMYWKSNNQEIEVTPVATDTKKEKKPLINNVGKEQGRKLKYLEREIEKLEEQVSEKEQEKSQLEERMAQPEVYSDIEKLSEINGQLSVIEKELEALHENWELKVIELEEINP